MTIHRTSRMLALLGAGLISVGAVAQQPQPQQPTQQPQPAQPHFKTGEEMRQERLRAKGISAQPHGVNPATHPAGASRIQPIPNARPPQTGAGAVHSPTTQPTASPKMLPPVFAHP